MEHGYKRALDSILALRLEGGETVVGVLRLRRRREKMPRPNSISAAPLSLLVAALLASRKRREEISTLDNSGKKGHMQLFYV